MYVKQKDLMQLCQFVSMIFFVLILFKLLIIVYIVILS
jgi:hypothetical protein